MLTWPAGHLSRRWDPLLMMVAGSVLYGVFLAVLAFLPGEHIVAAMAVGGVIAAPIGAILAKRFPAKTMLILVGIVLTLTSAFSLYRALFA